jgi:hypothetical protein
MNHNSNLPYSTHGYIDTTPALGGDEHKFTKRQPLKWMLRQMIVDAFSNRDRYESYKRKKSPTVAQHESVREFTKQYEADFEWMSDLSMHYQHGFAFAAVCDWLDLDREYVLKQFLGGCQATPSENRGGDWPIWGKKPHHLEEISIENVYQPTHSKHKWDRPRKERQL